MIYPSFIVNELYFKPKQINKLKKYLIALLIPIIIVFFALIISLIIKDIFPNLFSSAYPY